MLDKLGLMQPSRPARTQSGLLDGQKKERERMKDLRGAFRDALASERAESAHKQPGRAEPTGRVLRRKEQDGRTSEGVRTGV